MLLFTPDFTVNLTDSFLLGVTPIVVYTNSDLEKQRIIKENKGKSGIYRWVNKESVKSYVGSSVNLSNRFKQYYCYNHIADWACNMPINRASRAQRAMHPRLRRGRAFKIWIFELYS
jgi:hypothetical protein